MFYSPRNRGNMDRFYCFRSRSISAAQAPSGKVRIPARVRTLSGWNRTIWRSSARLKKPSPGNLPSLWESVAPFLVSDPLAKFPEWTCSGLGLRQPGTVG